MKIDVTKTPFSRYGSYVAVRAMEDHLLVRNVHNAFGDQAKYFELRFESSGQPVTCAVEATPWLLTARSSEGSARIVLRGDNDLLLESDCLDVHVHSLLGSYGHGYMKGGNRFRVHVGVGRETANIDTLRGEAEPDIRWEEHGGRVACVRSDLRVACEDGKAVLALAMAPYADERAPLPVDVDREIVATRAMWETFHAHMPDVPAERQGGAELAWYTLWSCTVRAHGLLAYDAVLMSKNWMTSVWSWDHCFNALALGITDARAGIEQLLLPFERQLPSGSLPDCINDGAAVYVSVKPPIHGWCLARLLDRHTYDRETLEKVYGHLTAWTDWWLTERDFDGNGVPNYVHSNESGADNATLFDQGQVLESPDLSAFLVLQMRALARLAGELGDDDDVARWTSRAETLSARMNEHLWQGDDFVARVDGSQAFDPHPTSLLVVLPLVLGEYLDPPRFATLCDTLEQRFLTPHGPASEMPSSPKYVASGGYGMRGPIWAPYVYLIADGLRRGGRHDMAQRMARTFCDTVDRSGSMWENFDALTGAGRDDPAYSWTASVYVLLAHEYLR